MPVVAALSLGISSIAGNVARGKGAKQSSTIYGGVPKRAVDGNRNSNWRGRSCTYTRRENRPWWRVDLGAIQKVMKVKVTNRGDCCWNRLKQVEIRVGMVDEEAGANAL